MVGLFLYFSNTVRNFGRVIGERMRILRASVTTKYTFYSASYIRKSSNIIRCS